MTRNLPVIFTDGFVGLDRPAVCGMDKWKMRRALERPPVRDVENALGSGRVTIIFYMKEI